MSTSISRRAAAMTLAVALAGCTIGDPTAHTGSREAGAAPTPNAPSAPNPAMPPPADAGQPTPGATTGAPASPIDAALAGVSGTASLAVSDGINPATTYGDDSGAVAWSTIKVPIAIAALQNGVAVTADLSAAITASDNAAAERMWASLGAGTQAGAAVQQVLAEGGDSGTQVQTERVRTEYTPFGQTVWTDAAAAQFAARLPCLAAGQDVIALMEQVTGTQQWGLYQGADGAAVKGGWGPADSGGYLVRQLAVLESATGATGVMITVRPGDGSLATGQSEVTAIANAVLAERARLPAATC